MNQENKKLLLQELCARMPYGVKVNAPFTSNKKENAKGYKINSINFGVVEWTPTLFGEKKRRNSIIIEAFSEKFNQYCSIDLELNNDIEEVKLYLFPLSSMTEEEKKEYKKICELDTEILVNHPMNGEPFPALYNSQDWLNKKMFDYRGLIEKGLAIDASGLNIY